MKTQLSNDGIKQYLDVTVDSFDQFSYRVISDLPNTFIKCLYQPTDPPICQYGLSGKRSLEHYIAGRVGFAQMLKIICQMAEQMLLLCDYLIDIRQVYLTDQTIFIDQLTDDVRLLVVPTDCYDALPTFQQWLVAHIAAHRALIYGSIDGAALYDYVQSNQFCLSGLIAFIKKLESERRTKSNNVEKNGQKNAKKRAHSENKVYNNASRTIFYTALAILQFLFIVSYLILYHLLPNITADLLAARLGALMILISLDIIASRYLMRHYKINGIANWSFGKLNSNRLKRASAATAILAKPDKAVAQLVDLATDKSYALNSNSILIGRQPGLDICLESRAIGRRHCKISTAEGSYFIEDLNSKNGTFINDKQLVTGVSATLKSGDKLRIANRELIFVNQSGY